LLGRALDILLEYTHTAAARIWLVGSSSGLFFHFHRGLFPDAFKEPAHVTADEYPAARVAAGRTSLFTDNLADVPELAKHGFVELLSVPMIAREQLVGVLDIAARHSGELDRERVWLVETAAPMLALAISDARIAADAAARESELQRLWHAGLDVAAAPDYAHTLRTVVDRARELVGADASALCLWDADKQWWVLQGTSGATDAFEVHAEPFAGRNGQGECPVVRFKYRRSHLDVPLSRDGQVIGCLCIASRQVRDFTSAERELVGGMAHQAAVAIDNVRRMEQAGTTAVNSERERLAREMHDTLAQLLGFVNFKAQAAREYVAQNDAPRATKQLEQLVSITQELYADTRELILGLRSVTTPQRGLTETLAEYCHQFGLLCELDVEFDPGELAAVTFPPMVELQVLRVTQEALSNVRKHAQASQVKVRGSREGAGALLCIADNGRGFDPERLAASPMPRFGLQSMRERVVSIGGRLQITSKAGEGTRVLVHLPLVYRGAEE
jgi:signal transduction histidine kinase